VTRAGSLIVIHGEVLTLAPRSRLVLSLAISGADCEAWRKAGAMVIRSPRWLDGTSSGRSIAPERCRRCWGSVRRREQAERRLDRRTEVARAAPDRLLPC